MFDAALARIKDSGCRFYAEFDGTGRGQINRLYGGRGVYFNDPDGHVYELITRPYGTPPEQWINGVAVKAKG
jgi:catechol 2,3-dioxygenase-like lactoylglutathione lyase family enzyme